MDSLFVRSGGHRPSHRRPLRRRAVTNVRQFIPVAMLAQHLFAVCLDLGSPHASTAEKHCQHVSEHVQLKLNYTPKFNQKLHTFATSI